MPIVYVERNGRTYVYRTESRRVPGRKNPVSMKEYIGILDPKTGMVDVKPLPIDAACSMLSDGRFSTLDRGSVLIASNAAERCGMRDALRCVFGDDGDMMLALAICYAINPLPSADRIRLLRGLDLEPVLGDAASTAGLIRRAISKIDYESIKRYAWTIREGSDGPVIVFGLSGRNGGLRHASMKSPMDHDADDVSLIFCSDDMGRPIAAGATIGRSMNAGAWRRMAIATGTNVRLVRVLDEISDNPPEIARMLMDGDRMTMRIGTCSDTLRSALGMMATEYHKAEHHGIEHDVYQGCLGIRLNNGAWTYVDRGRGNDDCMFTFNVFLTKPVRHIRNMTKSIGYTESSVSRMLRYNNLPHNDPATSHLISEIDGCIGSSVILTTEEQWEYAMDLINLRSMTLKQSHALIDSIFSADSSGSHGWERFLMFLSTGIRTAIARILEDGDSRLTVDDAFSLASRYVTIVSNGFRFHSDVSPDTKRVMDLFGSAERCSTLNHMMAV